MLNSLNHNQEFTLPKTIPQPCYDEVDDKRLVKVYPASCFQDFLEAYRLVYKEYTAQGLSNPSWTKMRFTALQLLPSTITVVATSKTEVVGAGCVVIDEAGTLPSSAFFSDHFAELREKGRKIAEGTMLTCINYQNIKANHISQVMIRWGLCWAAKHLVDNWCIVVHPKHVPFWHQKMGLEVLSPARVCDHVNNHPGVLLSLDLRKLRMGQLPATKMFQRTVLNHWVSPYRFRKYHQLTEENVEQLLAKQPEVLQNINPTLQKSLHTFFPRAINPPKICKRSYEAIKVKEPSHQDCEEMLKVLSGHILFQTLYSAIELQLFELLEEQPGLSLQEIATNLELQTQPTRILLLGLSNVKFIERKSKRYYNCPISQVYFVKASPKNIISIIKWQHSIVYKSMFHLHSSIKDNSNIGLCEIPGEGQTLYERLSQHPNLEQIFQGAMTELSTQANGILAESIELSNTKYLIDIGGGKGSNILCLAKSFPHLHASVFDLPTLCKRAEREFDDSLYRNRLSSISGDCFRDPLPKNADGFLLSHFCTIWSPEKNQKLFKKIYDALPTGGKLFIFNQMQNNDQSGPLVAAMGSPYFLALATGEGMLYTSKEYQEWLRRAGFAQINVQKLPLYHELLTAIKQ